MWVLCASTVLLNDVCNDVHRRLSIRIPRPPEMLESSAFALELLSPPMVHDAGISHVWHEIDLLNQNPLEWIQKFAAK